MTEVGNYETTEVYKIFIGYLRAVDGFLEFNEAIFSIQNTHLNRNLNVCEVLKRFLW